MYCKRGWQALLLVTLLALSLIFVSAESYIEQSPSDEWWSYGANSGYHRFTTANGPLNISNTTVTTITMPREVDNSPIIVGNSLFIVADSYYSSKAYELNALNISEVLQESTSNYDVSRSFTYYDGTLLYKSDNYLRQIDASDLDQSLGSDYIADSAGWSNPPTVFGDFVYAGAGNYNPYVKKYNASDINTDLEDYYIYSRPYESIAVVGDYAYLGHTMGLVQLNASDLTSYKSVTCLANNDELTFAVDADYVYKGCMIDDQMYTMQFNSSNVTHQIANISQGNSFWWSGPTLGNGYVYFNNRSTFYQADASNISIVIANYTLGASASSQPVITPDYVYIPAGSIMYQLNATNVSQLIGTYTAGGSIGGTPVVAKGFLYFGSSDSKLHQLGIYRPLLTATPISPSDNYEFGSAIENITFNCSAVDADGLQNISLYITDSSNANFAFNQSTAITGTSNSSSWTLELAEGNYTWNCLVYDAEDDSDWGVNRTMGLDVTDPVTTFVSPTFDDNYFTSLTSIEINSTITEVTLNELNYNWNGTNYTMFNDSLVLMYNFDNLSSLGEDDTTIVDVSTNTNDGAVTDAVWNSSGKYEGSFSFDGAGDFINAGTDSSLNFGTGDFSVALWFRIPSSVSAEEQIIGKRAGGSGNYEIQLAANSEILAYIGDGSDVTLDSNYNMNSNLNQWTHVFLTRYGGNAYLYVNGELKATAVSSHNVNSANALNLGRDVDLGSEYFTGNIDELRIWNTAFTQDQIYQQYVSNLNKYDTNAWIFYINQSKNATTTLSDGTYTYQIFSKDLKSNQDDSGLRNVTVDTVNPVFTAIVNQSVEYATAIAYDINATDNNLACFSVNNTDFQISCSGNLENDTVLTVGVYTLNITVNDSAGNEISDIMWVNVSDTILPVFTVMVNQTNNDLNDFAYDIDATDAANISCFSVNDTTYFQINCSGYLENSTVVPAGVYLLNVTVNDTHGNENYNVMWVNMTLTSNITLTMITPAISIMNLSQNSWNPITVNVSCTRNDCGDINVSLDAYYGNHSDVDIAFYCYSSTCSYSDDLRDYLNDSGFQVTAKRYNSWTESEINDSAYDIVMCGGYYYSCFQFTENAYPAAQDAWENESLGLVAISDYFYASGYTGVTNGRGDTDSYDDNIIDIQSHEIMTGFSGTASTDGDGLGRMTASNMRTPYTKLFSPQDYGSSYISGFAIDAGDAISDYTSGTNPGRAVFLGFDTADNHDFDLADATIIKQSTCWAATGTYDCVPLTTLVTDTSTTPFYINSTNPNDISLNQGESILVTFWVNATGSINSTYEFLMYANKTSDMTVNDITSSWNATIISGTDTTDPTITISSPVNNTNTSDTGLDIMYIASDGSLIDSCWYSDNQAANVTLSSCANITSRSWSEGVHTVIIYANDTIGNVGSSTVTFTIDTISPTISIVSPISNTNTTDASLDVTYTASDTNLDSCWYSNDTMNFNTTLSNCANITAVTWTEGQHNVTVWANDSADNKDSATTFFTVDLTAPSVSLNNPDDGYVNDSIGTANVLFNCSATDNYALANISLYITNSSNSSFSLYNTVGLSGINDSSSWTLSLSNGDYTWNCLAYDLVGYSNWSTNRTMLINTTSDIDDDGLPDTTDPLLHNESNVTVDGIDDLNITVGGNSTNGTFSDEQEIIFYDDEEPMINFTHNFTEANLDLSNITIQKADTYIIINLSGQLQGNKTVYIADNSFISLCVKDADVSSIDGVSSGCDGDNETDFTDCLGNNTGITLDGITCTDQGSTIKVDNLQFSAVKGTQAASVTTTPPTSDGAIMHGGRARNYCGDNICTQVYFENCITCPNDCGKCEYSITTVEDMEELDIIGYNLPPLFLEFGLNSKPIFIEFPGFNSKPVFTEFSGFLKED